MFDSVPVCSSSNNTQEDDQVSSNLVIAEPRRVTETFVVELDPGKVGPHDQIPLNRGPVAAMPEGIPVYHYDRQTGEYASTNYLPDVRTSYIKTFNEMPGKTFASLDPPQNGIPRTISMPIQRADEPADEDDDSGISKSNDPRAKRLGQLRDYLGWGSIPDEFTESALRRQAMKARRLTRILGEGWIVQYCAGAAQYDDADERDNGSSGHQFFVSPDWFMDQETWADDRVELGPMEDQIAEQLDAFAKRFSDAAKKLRKASAGVEFIKRQLEARKATPCNPSHEAQELANDLAALTQRGLVEISTDGAIAPSQLPANSTKPPLARDVFSEYAEKFAADHGIELKTKPQEQWATSSQATTGELKKLFQATESRQFFDACMARGMDYLMSNTKPDELDFAADAEWLDCKNVNAVQDAADNARKLIANITAGALMLTNARREVIESDGNADYSELLMHGITWPYQYERQLEAQSEGAA